MAELKPRMIARISYVWEFYDFDQQENPHGALKRSISPGGMVTSVVSYNDDDRITEIQRSYAFGESTVTESLVYSYVASGDNEGRLDSVTMRRKIDAGGWTTIRGADYTYYGSEETHGNLGDLKKVTQQLPGGAKQTFVHNTEDDLFIFTLPDHGGRSARQ